ncbi:MAG: type IVB secretion system protein DotA [Gammaproteobacteria bacterium]|nr:type IVB secretion system protein DotA [Gammaproteobacteria bacterium]
MISLFQIAPNDQSIYYLSKVFGVVGSLLPSGSPTLLLGIMFKTLNTVVLTIGAFIVVYVTIVGLIKTAQEGEFLGKQWNSVWVPLRTVFGIAALFPMSSGYCAIQVIFMWVIVQGIGAADTLWQTAIKASAVLGSPTQSMTVPTGTSVNFNMQKLFQALVCQAEAKESRGDIKNGQSMVTPSTTPFYCTSPNSQADSTLHTNFCGQSDELMLDPINNTGNLPSGIKSSVNGTLANSTYYLGPGGACGKVTFCSLPSSAPNPTDSTKYPKGTQDLAYIAALADYNQKNTYCKAQQQALSGLMSVLGAIAKQFADNDYSALQLYSKDSYDTTSTPPKLLIDSPGWLQDYCSTNNIQNCCLQGSLKDTTSAPCGIVGITMGENNSTGTDIKSTDAASSSSSSDNTKVVNKLYFPALRQYLGDQNLNFISSAIGQYTSAMLSAEVQDLANQINNKNISELDQWQKDAIQVGWIQAGSFLFQIANQTGKGVQSINDYFSTTYFNVDATSPAGEMTTVSYRNNFSAANNLISIIYDYIQNTGQYSPEGGSQAATQDNAGSGSTGVPGLSNISSVITKGAGTIVSDFIQNLSGQSGYSSAGVNANGVYGAVYNPIMATAVGVGAGVAAGGIVAGTAAGGLIGAAAGGAVEGGIAGIVQGTGGYSKYTGTTNPLVSMTKFGRQLIETATTLFWTVLAVAAVITLLSTFNITFFASGMTSNVLGEVVKLFFGILGPLLSLLLGAIFSFGAVLSVYVPLIPYMIFIAGGMGWILATVEAMVAAPIVALGILSPGGQHDILGRSEPAAMLLLNLFLRPSLMVFGLMAGILVSIAIMSMVNAGFLNAMYSINSDPGLFESAFFIAIYCTIVITVISKSFSLIYVIPERVLTWIGGPAVQYGEQEMLQSAKQAVESAAGGISKAGGEAGQAGLAGIEKTRTAKALKDWHDKQPKSEPGASTEPPATPGKKK